MKAVLISIQPKWCELIARGKKTVEVRKTKPKIETPFKVYIYESSGNQRVGNANLNVMLKGEGRKKVIGEFVCKAIIPISISYSNPNSRIASREFPYTCLTDKEIMDYLGNGKEGYGWCISDLIIYDKPKELSEFRSYNVKVYYDEELKLPMPTHEITRPPQSWCYVEEMAGYEVKESTDV